jgi:hypothetical protein
MLNKNFFYASTIKTPYLSEDEAKSVVEKLKERYI